MNDRCVDLRVVEDVIVRNRWLSVWMAALGICGGSFLPGAEPGGEEFFETRIRPLLIERCGDCHGGSRQEGGLSLASHASALKGGETGPALNAEQPLQSLMLHAVMRTGDLQMPPKESLSEAEQQLIRQWLELGAPWPNQGGPIVAPSEERVRRHWAFQPVGNPQVPAVERADWPLRAMDHFVYAKLQEAGLQPSMEADRRTLIRRVSYTLTGLPPSAAEIDQFVQDADPQAYEKLVERLLNSPQYGEHWARHWLDLARYSDTKGYVYAREERVWVHAWTYRDWVVQAFNRDLPYDQFLKLQIAADQVPNRAEGDLAAMGFLTLGRRFLGVPWDIIDDRIDTLCRGTMGLTVACARCHDHKYDPIPTADYYSLYGVFASSEERLLPLPNGTRNPAFQEELQKRLATLETSRQAARLESADRARSRVRDYLWAQTELQKYPAQGFDQIFYKEDLLPQFVRQWQQYLHQAARRGDRVFTVWHRFAGLTAEEFLQRAPQITAEIVASGGEDQCHPWIKAQFQTAPQNFGEVVDRYAAVLQQVDAQWKQAVQAARDAQMALPTQLADPLAEELRRVLYGPTAPSDVPDEPVVHIEQYFDSDTINALWKTQGEVDRWIIQSGSAEPHTVALFDRAIPSEPRILKRGNPINYGDDVSRQFLALLSGPERQPFHQGSGRYELAQAITSPENPLTARVLVNRVWLQHFGQGLVRSPSDFGMRAAPPSHPELLDWLARSFIEQGWSLKHLHRELLLSRTFRQSSAGSGHPQFAQAEQLDPDNRLLWRMNPHRLTFEEFRDSLLAAAGDLDPTLGGQPVNLFAAPFPKRRTLYGMVDRQFLPSTLRIFDFANPDLHIPQRSETTVPQQMLFLLNHPLVLDRAKGLAQVTANHADPKERITALFERALLRSPTPVEQEDALAFVEQLEGDPLPTPSATAPDWQYGYGSVEETAGKTVGFEPLPHFTGNAWQGGPNWPDATLGWVQLTATGGHPGNDRQHAAVRRWTAPRDMTVSITSKVSNEVEPGDGIRAFVISSRQGILKNVYCHREPQELTAAMVQVTAGETVDFVVDIDQELNSDQFLWQITLQEQQGEGVQWNAQADFPPQQFPSLNPWEQLAQALLGTNEFLFVD